MKTGLPVGEYEKILRRFSRGGRFVNPLDDLCKNHDPPLMNVDLVRLCQGEIDSSTFSKYRRWTPEAFLAEESVLLPTPIDKWRIEFQATAGRVQQSVWHDLDLLEDHLSTKKRRARAERMVGAKKDRGNARRATRA